MTLRAEFAAAYGTDVLETLNKTLSAYALNLKDNIARIIEGEKQKDPNVSASCGNMIEVASITSNIAGGRITTLPGFKELLKACADKDVDIKVSILMPPKRAVVGFKNDGAPAYKISLDMAEPFSSSLLADCLKPSVVAVTPVIKMETNEKPRYRVSASGISPVPSTRTRSSGLT